MFQKISDEESFTGIQKGDWIVKYPLTGHVADEIDLSDERFFMLYEVYEIDHGSGIIHLKNLDLPVTDQNQQSSNGTGHGSFSLVEKHKNDLIEDCVWWHR